MLSGVLQWFSGTFPSEMGMLTALKFLRVGYNMLSGSLPDTLTRLTSLALLEFQVLNDTVM